MYSSMSSERMKMKALKKEGRMDGWMDGWMERVRMAGGKGKGMRAR
jgi:hypothetical protein